MVLTLSTTHKPATDLGFLLHKNPSRLHTVELTFGKAHVVYSEVSDERCSATVLLEIDPVRLVRGVQGPSGEGGLFNQYVNDRPYATNSFMSSAISELFRTAMRGRSKERSELALSEIPLEVRIPVLPCRGGEDILRRLFVPLGYEVEASRLPLDERFPEWGGSHYYDVTFKTGLLSELLTHLYVLIPVLDNEKHYWVDQSEIDKLLLRGKAWLANHPAKQEIARRYLRGQAHLTREALARLAEEEGDSDPDLRVQGHDSEEAEIERPISLHEVRLNTVLAVLKESGARRVLDLGCGEGRLIALLLKEKQFAEIAGVDVSWSVLQKAQRRLKVDRLPTKQAERLKLLHGSLVYRDRRLDGYDAAAVVEVIEHLDMPRLAAFERNLFQFARPQTIVVTTPNREYNELFGSLHAGQMRHRDHRFEWTRAEFERWASERAREHGYGFRILPIGPLDPNRGAPSQMAIFTRGGGASNAD